MIWAAIHQHGSIKPIRRSRSDCRHYSWRSGYSFGVIRVCFRSRLRCFAFFLSDSFVYRIQIKHAIVIEFIESYNCNQFFFSRNRWARTIPEKSKTSILNFKTAMITLTIIKHTFPNGTDGFTCLTCLNGITNRRSDGSQTLCIRARMDY